VEVGEHEHERALARQRLEVRLDGPECFVPRSRRIHVGALAEPPQQVQEPVRDALDVGVVRVTFGDARDGCLDLLAGVVRRVVELDAARVPDRFCHRPPDVRLAVGETRRLEHGRAPLLVRHRRQLDREPALAHPGFTEQHHQLRALAVERRVEHAAQQRHLGVASHE
jgi:hypothetical protein